MAVAVVVVKWFMVLTFYTDDPSSNPAEAYRCFCKFAFEKNENKQKEAGLVHLAKST